MEIMKQVLGETAAKAPVTEDSLSKEIQLASKELLKTDGSNTEFDQKLTFSVSKLKLASIVKTMTGDVELVVIDEGKE